MDPHHYRTKQTANWIRLLALLLALTGLTLTATFGLAKDPVAFIGLLIVALSAVLFGFSSLHVYLSNNELRWHFGLKVFAGSARLDHVREVSIRRIAWYWGFGIRWTRHGWLWRSTGLNTVWIRLSNGKQIGLGSDTPEELADAIRRASAALH